MFLYFYLLHSKLLAIIGFMRDYEFYYTQDGSIGLYSYADEDVYHSKFGAITEAWEKFVIPAELETKLSQQNELKVLDVCYGIGYNTKALMSYIINLNEKKLKKINFLQKIIKKIKQKLFKQSNIIETIDVNNNINEAKVLSTPIETINGDNEIGNLPHVKIDCLELNEELVKISPLLKTVITPQEIFSRIIPKIFDCFETYWKIRKFLAKISFIFLPKNKRKIKELLDLKFNNDYDLIDNEYRIHKFVNYILVDTLNKHYNNKYFDKELRDIIKDKRKRRFFERALIKYAKFKQSSRYNLLSKFNLYAFLHNIYYDHLSFRYKKADYKIAEKLFNVSFHIDDARKSILGINEQYDLIFLDAFTFSKAPELWTVEFMAELYRKLSPNGLLMTYSNSALVRNTFLENNFYIGKIYCERTNKFIGTVAAKEKNLIKYPLTNYEIGLCGTRAGIPYRDPLLNYTKEQILRHRENEFKTSDLLTSSQYMRIRASKKEGNSNE